MQNEIKARSHMGDALKPCSHMWATLQNTLKPCSHMQDTHKATFTPTTRF